MATDHDTTSGQSDFVHDDLIANAEQATRGSSNLFDLRTVIGALFTLYGLLLTILGILDSQAEIDKAAGVRINLWTGLGMLALGLAFCCGCGPDRCTPRSSRRRPARSRTRARRASAGATRRVPPTG